MKRRARRALIGAAVLAAVLVAVLVVTHRGTVCDHLTAWQFQLTRGTKIMDPRSLNQGEMITTPQILATYSNRRVIFDPAAERESSVWQLHRSRTLDFVLNVLRRDGYRVLEQRFPQRAYVLMRGADPVEPMAVPPRARTGSTRFQPILWDGVYPRPEAVRSSESPVSLDVEPWDPGAR